MSRSAVFAQAGSAAAWLRPATPADLPAVNGVIERAVMTWKLAERVKRLSLPSYRYHAHDLVHLQLVVAEDMDQALVGVAAWEAANPRDLPDGQSGLLLHGLYVDPAHQHRGIGSLLLDAAEAAALENRYWEMNNLLYTRQSEWLDLSTDEFTSWLITQAGFLNISPAQWEASMANETVIARVDQTITDATSLQLSSTPVLFFNNILVKTSLDMDSLSVLVDYFLLPEKAYSTCPVITIDSSKTYTATFTTEKGAIVFELFNDIAPLSVNSFVTLARAGWYDGSAFFRVIPGFVAQGGDPSNSGLGTPGYGISAEVDPSLRFDAPGLLALNQNSDGLSGCQRRLATTTTTSRWSTPKAGR